MNLKLNIKVLQEMENDFGHLISLTNRIGDPQVKAKFAAEIEEKLKAVQLLKDHYKRVLSQVQAINQR